MSRRRCTETYANYIYGKLMCQADVLFICVSGMCDWQIGRMRRGLQHLSAISFSTRSSSKKQKVKEKSNGGQ